jgi:uncharacterized membrane protein/mono/diheme cytochrome c family protein
MNLVYFLGRLHVVVLHLPIGIVLVTLAVELLARRERFRALAELTSILWWAAAVTAVVTATLGLMHAQEGAVGAAVTWHRAFGLTFAAAVVAAAVLRQLRPGVYKFSHVPIAIALVVLVTLTGHYGGNITHGSDFLVEYAPEPLRRLAGVEARRVIVIDPAKADAYLDVVQPVFDAHCTVCHNDSRKKGGLSLAGRARLMAGGRDGAVVVPGDANASELYRRVTLPADDEHAMPAEGKAKLSDRDKQLIEWWIKAGAPANVTVARLGGIPGGEAPAVAGQSNADRSQASITSSIPAATPESLARLAAIGFVIRPVAQDSPLLDVAFVKGQHIDAAQFESLLTIKDQVADLNLRAAGLSDAQLRVIAQLSHLEHLRIELNDITDAGVRELARLSTLRSLNLYGTKVTDASLETLMRMPSLRDVYLFETAVSDVALARVQAVNRLAHGKLALHKT